MKTFQKLMILLPVWLWSNMNEAYSQNSSEPIRFGIIADIQYADCNTQGNRYYRNSLEKLKECITELNQQKVQFTVTLGDLIDRNPADLKPVTDCLKKLNTRVYHTTGNHDYKGTTDNKKLFRQLNMPSEYYSFQQGDWLFIMLNTNEIASYSNLKDNKKKKELVAMQNRIKTSKRNNGQNWNGGISSQQLEWLHKLLQKAQKKGEKVLIFSHHPLYPATAFTALNDQEILDTLSGFTCVKGVISGHHHAGAFAYYNGLPCITTEGMIESKDENAYCIVEIRGNELILTGYGRSKSYKISLK